MAHKCVLHVKSFQLSGVHVRTQIFIYNFVEICGICAYLIEPERFYKKYTKMNHSLFGYAQIAQIDQIHQFLPIQMLGAQKNVGDRTRGNTIHAPPELKYKLVPSSNP